MYALEGCTSASSAVPLVTGGDVWGEAEACEPEDRTSARLNSALTPPVFTLAAAQGCSGGHNIKRQQLP